MGRLVLALVLSGVIAGGCTTSPEPVEAGDRLEPLNRRIFAFNEFVYENALDPTVEVYTTVTPEPVRDGLRNVLSTANQPVVFANALLQGEPRVAVDAAGRFVLNATVGVFGVFDVATQANIARHQRDLGQTLGVWGVPSGSYVVLPILGPSTLRDSAGRVGDSFIEPIGWNREYATSTWAAGVELLDVVDLHARNEESVEAIRRNAIDPYVQIRNIYLQARESAVNKGEIDVENLPDF